LRDGDSDHCRTVLTLTRQSSLSKAAIHATQFLPRPTTWPSAKDTVLHGVMLEFNDVVMVQLFTGHNIHLFISTK